jgi:putative endonuclease
MKLHLYYVYILSSNNNNAIYVGITNDLARRVYEHKSKLNAGFTSKYNINKLVYYETFDFIDLAIKREKQIKKYPRDRKNSLINSFNPDWNDLYTNGKIEKL